MALSEPHLIKEALPVWAGPGEAAGGQEGGGGEQEAAQLPVWGGQAAKQAGQTEARLQAGTSDNVTKLCHL